MAMPVTPAQQEMLEQSIREYLAKTPQDREAIARAFLQAQERFLAQCGSAIRNHPQ